MLGWLRWLNIDGALGHEQAVDDLVFEALMKGWLALCKVFEVCNVNRAAPGETRSGRFAVEASRSWNEL
jgi:hypothetical protein